jgi:hypothetical protein
MGVPGAIPSPPGQTWLDQVLGAADRAEAAADRAENSGGSDGGSSDSSQNVTLTSEQINALDGMFQVCAFAQNDVSAQYSAFRSAFGLDGSGGGDIPDDDDHNLLNFGGNTVVFDGTGTATIINNHSVSVSGGYVGIVVDGLTPGAQYSFGWTNTGSGSLSVYGAKISGITQEPANTDIVKIKANCSHAYAENPYVFTLPETCVGVIIYPYDGYWTDLSLREVV